MQSRGFSLVEMMCIIAIIAILAVIGTLRFQDYALRYRTEAQTRLLFTELLKARTNAICQRRGTRVKVFTDRFEVYSSQADESTVCPLETHRLSYPITFSKTLEEHIDFAENGTASDWGSICLEPVAGSGAVDSVVIAATRVKIGRKDKGNDCKSESVTPE
jgi:prepilin-type N-terminal cleavage/methylation domain-containing protein